MVFVKGYTNFKKGKKPFLRKNYGKNFDEFSGVK